MVSGAGEPVWLDQDPAINRIRIHPDRGRSARTGRGLPQRSCRHPAYGPDRHADPGRRTHAIGAGQPSLDVLSGLYRHGAGRRTGRLAALDGAAKQLVRAEPHRRHGLVELGYPAGRSIADPRNGMGDRSRTGPPGMAAHRHHSRYIHDGDGHPPLASDPQPTGGLQPPARWRPGRPTSSGRHN